MKRTQIAIRRIGNSQGIVIPKPLLAQVGLEGHAEMSIERDALVLRRPARAARAGWAAAAKKIADHDNDALVMGEFGNEDDAELTW
jgi:antitoxin MazE